MGADLAAFSMRMGLAGVVQGRIFASSGFYLREFEYICEFRSLFATFKLYLRLLPSAGLCGKPVISNFWILLATF
ncbi:hypothetical protein CYJ37_21750 [Bacillus sp. UMB0728]|nr:hypothetical protein CYJ37_21750 [Bacillus sp. UMB0728]